MDRELIERLLSRRPFEPFDLRLSSGQSVAVRHPAVAVLGRAKLFVVDPERDLVDIVGLLHVVNVRTAQVA